MENRRLQLRYGKVTRPYKMAEVSNSKLSEVRSRRLCLPKMTKILNRPRFFDASPNFVDGKRPWIPTMSRFLSAPMWKKRPSSWENSRIGTLQMCVLDIS